MGRMLEQLLYNPAGSGLMIALVGAGGKTTHMKYLATYFKARNKSVVVTTTTRIFMPEDEFYDAVCLNPQELDEKVLKKGTITVIGEGVEANGKLVAVDPLWLNAIYERKIVDVILVEADGSKRKPIKAPAEHEPVIPDQATHVIGVIGLDALGTPIDAAHVHRVESFKRVVQGNEGDLITPEMIVRLIRSDQGLFKGVSQQAQKIVVLNKACDEHRRATGKTIKDSLDNKAMHVLVRS